MCNRHLIHVESDKRDFRIHGDDRLRVEQKMLKGHLPRVTYHQVYFNIRRLNLKHVKRGCFEPSGVERPSLSQNTLAAARERETRVHELQEWCKIS